ncbi:MAG TPA: SDR family oxidoreductase, partial [Streptosporangiaceae bacterium]|nr:SDR family oxidoreductase [Streptosporangiaceae bacterium]
ADCEALAKAILDKFGKIDVLVNNAGITKDNLVIRMSDEEWDRVLAVNLTGAFLLAKYGIPELAAAGGGTMVITGSANSFTADRSWAAYCASKGGLLMLCRALALDHAADGIRVNIVCPGSVTTPLHEEWLAGRPGGQTLAQTRDADRAAHPLGRFADPAEVARAALFLSCAESSFTTGAPLLVDGGVTA